LNPARSRIAANNAPANEAGPGPCLASTSNTRIPPVRPTSGRTTRWQRSRKPAPSG